MIIRLTAELEKEIEEKLENSTKVVKWYPYAYPHTVRGPYGRWFLASGGEIYGDEHVADIQDDVKYCAIAMNSVPILLNEIKALRKEISDLKYDLQLKDLK